MSLIQKDIRGQIHWKQSQCKNIGSIVTDTVKLTTILFRLLLVMQSNQCNTLTILH